MHHMIQKYKILRSLNSFPNFKFNAICLLVDKKIPNPTITNQEKDNNEQFRTAMARGINNHFPSINFSKQSILVRKIAHSWTKRTI